MYDRASNGELEDLYVVRRILMRSLDLGIGAGEPRFTYHMNTILRIIRRWSRMGNINSDLQISANICGHLPISVLYISSSLCYAQEKWVLIWQYMPKA